MVWDRHCLEGDLLGILEVGVWPPDPVEPLDWQELILSRHVGGQPQPVIIPLLSKKYVRNICLKYTAILTSNRLKTRPEFDQVKPKVKFKSSI